MPTSVTELLESFPPELQLPMARLVDALKEELQATKSDFIELRTVVQELAEAQRRTEPAVKELTETQTKFSRTFYSQMGALGARWGLQAEGAFREGMRAILQEVGFSTERFSVKDSTGEALGYPEQIELDIIVKDGKLIVAEIKSSIDREHIVAFNRKVAFYTRKTGQQVDRKVIMAPHVEAGTQELADELGVEVCTDINELS